MKDFLQGKWLKHPLHPPLVHIPTALWPAAAVLDILSLLGYGGNAVVQTSFYAILLGLLVALLAVPTGIADWYDIKREKPAWKLGVYHLVLNVVVSILAVINVVLRLQTYQTAISIPGGLALLSVVTTLVLLAASYLGSRMIYAYGINVARLSKEKLRERAKVGGAALPSATSPSKKGS